MSKGLGPRNVPLQSFSVVSFFQRVFLKVLLYSTIIPPSPEERG